MHKRGLIVGKFYPPHRGHQYLIEFAKARVEKLFVLLCEKPGESPSGSERSAWLRELYPEVEILLIDDRDDEQDMRRWAENSIRWLGFRPDAVFSSESYGDAFADHLGCEHIPVDPARATVPVSGTAVRRDPFKYWLFLSPPVRAFYALRVCLVGAESTGKTTLAQSLARHYKTVWVPEYGREYTEIKVASGTGSEWTTEDFIRIAEEQCRMENEAARNANRVLICDTDAFATAIWHRRYMNTRSPEVERIAAMHRYPDLYLLLNIDVPFVQDRIRDGESIRPWMHQVFLEELNAGDRPYQVLSQSYENRFTEAIQAIDRLILRREQSEVL